MFSVGCILYPNSVIPCALARSSVAGVSYDVFYALANIKRRSLDWFLWWPSVGSKGFVCKYFVQKRF